MTIHFLGTGTSQGIPIIGCDCAVCRSTDSKDKRLRTSCLIEIDGTRVVIDTGPDFRQQMLTEGGREIHGVLMTHEHNDHIAGLDDVRPFNFKYEKDMPIYGLSRVLDAIQERFPYIFKKEPYPGAPVIRLNPISDSPFFIERLEIIPIHIMHGKLPILGYRIQNFAYLTDVKYISDNEIKKLRGLDVLVLSALRLEEHHSHLTLGQAIALAQKIGAQKTYFTHFSHWLGCHKEIETKLPKGIHAAYDTLSFSF